MTLVLDHVLVALDPQDCLFHLAHHPLEDLCRWYKDAWMLSTRQRPGLPAEQRYVLAYEKALLDALGNGRTTGAVPAPRSTEEP